MHLLYSHSRKINYVSFFHVMNPRRGPVESPLVTIAIAKLIAGVLEKNNLTGSVFTSFVGAVNLIK